MSLEYLSGDDSEAINGKKKKSGGAGGGKKRSKKSKATKKAGRKRIKKKIAKVALAPARAAFLTACRLNLIKLSTKIVRVWNKPQGKEKITNFWQELGGDINKLKAAVSKGAKQQISGASIGVVATTVLATATPIVVALVPIIKAFKAGGDKKEAQEFNDGVEQGKKDLAENPEIEKGEASMPKNKDAGFVTDKGGDAQESDKENKKQRKESDSGGHEGEESPKEKSGGGSSDESGGGKSEEEKKAEAEKKMGSNFSPLGLFFMTLIYCMMYAPKNNLFFELLSTYCFAGMLLIPVAIEKNIFQRFAKIIVFTPINLINSFNSKLKSKWQKI